MIVEASGVAKGRRGSVLPPTDVRCESGSVTLIPVETEPRPTVLGLILTGRMTACAGTVTIDGREDAAELRRRVALVDAVDVTEPEGLLPLRTLVREQLLFAGLSVSRDTVDATLAECGGSEFADLRTEDAPVEVRLRLLCELAVCGSEVEGLVLSRPDRHGGTTEGWWAVVAALADRDYAVAVTVSEATAAIAEPLREERQGHRVTRSGAHA